MSGLPEEWTSLGGEWRSEVSHNHNVPDDTSAFLVTQRISSVRKVAAWVPVTRELLDDAGSALVENLIYTQMDRHFRPWLYPDRRQWPTFEPFPRVTRLLSWIKRALRTSDREGGN